MQMSAKPQAVAKELMRGKMIDKLYYVIFTHAIFDEIIYEGLLISPLHFKDAAGSDLILPADIQETSRRQLLPSE